MSSVTGYFNDAAAAGQAGYGLFNQIDRALHGNKQKVHFVQNNVTIIEFDIVLNEGHSFAVSPTQFPIESNSVISDHATVAPIQLNLTGLISDYPVETRDQLINSTVSSVVTAATTPLGAAGVLGATVGYSTLAVQNTAVSRSAKIFADLQRVMGIKLPKDNAKDAVQTPQERPQIFDVITRLRRYPSMMITQMQLNRDSTSGPTNMVFSLTLQQVQIAFAQFATVSTSLPIKAAKKQQLGEGEEEVSKLKGALDAGTALEKSTFGAAKEFVLSVLPGTP